MNSETLLVLSWTLVHRFGRDGEHDFSASGSVSILAVGGVFLSLRHSGKMWHATAGTAKKKDFV